MTIKLTTLVGKDIRIPVPDNDMTRVMNMIEAMRNAGGAWIGGENGQPRVLTPWHAIVQVEVIP